MRFSHSRPVTRFATTIAFAGTIGLSGGAAALAQDATPAATPIGPEGAACMAPAVAVGATPVATPVGAADASAVDYDNALATGPVIEDEAVVSEATMAIENIYACWNDGDGEAVVALFTNDGLDAAYGANDRETIAEQVTALAISAEASNVQVEKVVDLGEGRLGVDYQVTLGSQVFRFTDVLVERDGTWMVDHRIEDLPGTTLDSTTSGIETSVEDGSLVFDISPNPVLNQPAVKIQFSNAGETTHHITLLRNEGGVDAATVTDIDPANLPEGLTYVGEATVEPGEFTDTLFEGLDEGSYVLVGEVLDDSGEPTGEGSSTELIIDPAFDPDA